MPTPREDSERGLPFIRAGRIHCTCEPRPGSWEGINRTTEIPLVRKAFHMVCGCANGTVRWVLEMPVRHVSGDSALGYTFAAATSYFGITAFPIAIPRPRTRVLEVNRDRNRRFARALGRCSRALAGGFDGSAVPRTVVMGPVRRPGRREEIPRAEARNRCLGSGWLDADRRCYLKHKPEDFMVGENGLTENRRTGFRRTARKIRIQLCRLGHPLSFSGRERRTSGACHREPRA